MFNIQVQQALLKIIDAGLASGVVWVQSPQESSGSFISGPIYRTSQLEEVPIVMSEFDRTENCISTFEAKANLFVYLFGALVIKDHFGLL